MMLPEWLKEKGQQLAKDLDISDSQKIDLLIATLYAVYEYGWEDGYSEGFEVGFDTGQEEFWDTLEDREVI